MPVRKIPHREPRSRRITQPRLPKGFDPAEEYTLVDTFRTKASAMAAARKNRKYGYGSKVLHQGGVYWVYATRELLMGFKRRGEVIRNRPSRPSYRGLRDNTPSGGYVMGYQGLSGGAAGGTPVGPGGGSSGSGAGTTKPDTSPTLEAGWGWIAAALVGGAGLAMLLSDGKKRKTTRRR